MTNIQSQQQIIESLTKEIIQLDDRLFQVYLANKYEWADYTDLKRALIEEGFKINSINTAEGWIRIEGEI